MRKLLTSEERKAFTLYQDNPDSIGIQTYKGYNASPGKWKGDHLHRARRRVTSFAVTGSHPA